MRISLAQLNLRIGDIDYNLKKILASIRKATSKGADLIVFSELTICGYSPLDLLQKDDFIYRIELALERITATTQDIAVIVGAPKVNKSKAGKGLYNSAYFIYRKKVQYVQHKTLLPNYNVFNESRYFEPKDSFGVVNFKCKKIALSVCEDIWAGKFSTAGFASSYEISPIAELAKLKPDLLVNLSASPFSYNKSQARVSILANIAKENKLPTVFVSQVGGYTDLIFDGDSKAFNDKGQLICQLSRFKEDMQIFSLPEQNTLQFKPNNPIVDIHSALLLGIKDYLRKTGFQKVVIGLSGGIDSAVTAVLATQALGKENVRALLLPSEFSSAHSVEDAVSLAKKLGIQYHTIKINEIYDSFIESLSGLFKNSSFDITEENVQARIRGTLLMAVANKHNYMLLNTSNKSEIAVGYGTLYGDLSGGLSVLGDLYKTQVYELARHLNRVNPTIPLRTIEKPPSAELRPNQLDTHSLPEYEVLDKILYRYINLNYGADKIVADGFDYSLVKKVITMVHASEYKRYQAPPALRVSNRAFGKGWQFALDSRVIFENNFFNEIN